MQAIDQNISRRAEALSLQFSFELERSLQANEADFIYGEEGTCNLCSKTFARRSSLLTHIRNHSAERKFICSYCQKGFTQAANLRNHERIHTNIRPYVCVDCGKAFTQITNLNNHRRLHTGERPFVCIELDCGRSFAQVTNLNNHMKSHHKIQQYVCNQCPRRFTQVTSLNQHLLVHAGFSGFYCTHCPDKSFKTHIHLQQHLKSHGLNFPYECTKCEEKFQQLTHLNQHMHIHDEFKYKCSMCDSTFNQEGLLKKHIQRHLDGRYINCPIPGCVKGFTLKHHLTKHLQTAHSNSVSKRLHVTHKRSSGVPGKHNCYFDSCDAYFDTQDELNDHLTDTHGLSIVRNADKRSKLELNFTEQLKNYTLPSNGLHLSALLNNIKSENPNDAVSGETLPMTTATTTASTSPTITAAPNSNNISTPKSQTVKSDDHFKCHECDIFYNSERDLRVHIFYKHPQKLAN